MMDPERLRMFEDRILLRAEPLPSTAGAIHLPDGAMETAMGTAVVLRTGPGLSVVRKAADPLAGVTSVVHTGRRHPVGVRPGDRVALLWHHLDNMRLPGTDLAVVAERDLWGVIESH